MASSLIFRPYMNIGSLLLARDVSMESDEMMSLININFLSSKSTDSSLTIFSRDWLRVTYFPD